MMSDLFVQLGEHLENSIRIQMQFYPDDWSDADKREMAIKHLGYGRDASACPVTRISEHEVAA
ncbi:hypothetical protein BSL82_09690 [Tardibacter chloracetimidivorans]|uniref:Uncharacterized protein n=2 Tax=Tardibacter chloracetimidivorans TaxID=1921510 RepID=A0A1L3ZVA0_9SPHN|nr:hypothetical protein BSL82_09690 [Tardibacter chloracetimidivorans]